VIISGKAYCVPLEALHLLRVLKLLAKPYTYAIYKRKNLLAEAFRLGEERSVFFYCTS